MMHYTELQHIGFYLTNYADRLVGIKLALMSARKRKNKSIKQSIRNNTKHHNIADF